MGSFEFLSSEHFHVILHSDQKHGLIINRLDSCLSTINYDDAKELSNLRKVGTFYGIVGLFLGKYLVLIKNRTLVGKLFEPATKTEHEIFVINSIQVFDVACPPSPCQAPKTGSVRYNVSASGDGGSIEEESARVEDTGTVENLNKASDYDEFTSLPIKISTGSFASIPARTNNWNPFKLANSLKPMMPAQFLKSSGLESVIGDGGSGSSSSVTNQQAVQSSEDAGRRLVEEMIKLFNGTDSFYFSWTLDLSHRFSRQASLAVSSDKPMWKTADDRFFWNKYMLKDLIELSETEQDVNYFISVILQGFIAIEEHIVTMNNESGIESGRLATNIDVMAMSRSNISGDNAIPADCYSINSQPETKTYQLILISRRSVFQAGTRYRRRGCDEKGNCANFVETEQIFRYNQHVTSFLSLRGSIPLYWYQTGINYRPPPVLYRTEQENFDAISKHFDNLIKTYETDHIIAVDCTEHTGREQAIHNAYKMYVEKLSITQPNIRLIEFDFHKHCHGRHCTQIVVEKHLRSSGLTHKMLKDVKYYWNDGDLVWKQDGVFRVNCLDCTDRTNVVQCAIALQVLDIQLARLGIIAPDTCPSDNECREIMRDLWSRNGNVLSTQYCGTRALFTGDRKLSGYIKDTYSSASRYYISKFRDASRQAAIDAMLGVDGSSKDPSGSESSDSQVPAIDQYELINLDPMITGRGGALLKDMGNRMSNRLARLRGKFYSKRPLDFYSTNISEHETSDLERADAEIEARLTHTLDGLNIDWPSTESMEVNDNMKSSGASNLFAQISNSDDNFQDEDFGSLMLSVDLADLQRVRNGDESDNKDRSAQGGSATDQENARTREEILMTETRGFGSDSVSSHHDVTTSTTST